MVKFQNAGNVSGREGSDVNEVRSRYIDPRIDGGFKILFGTEEKKELTESLLSSILGFEVCDLVFLNTEPLPKTVAEKVVRYDILCSDSTGNKYLLEMQVKGHSGLLERTFYYLGRCISSQLGKGSEYTNLKGVYGIYLTWCTIGKDSDSFIKDFVFTNVYNPDEKIEGIRQIFINLQKFEKGEAECRTMMDKWLYNLKNMNRKNDVAFAEREEIFRKLKKYAEESNMTPDEKILYDLRLDAWRDYYIILEENSQVAREEGMAKGREEERLAMAKSLLTLNVPVETIARASGLTEAEILALQVGPIL